MGEKEKSELSVPNRNYRDTVFRMLFREKKEQPLADAVEQAVNECIEEGILTDFLRKNRSEVIPMSIFEYDEEKHIRTVRNEGYEDGRIKGREEGNRQSALRMLETGKLSPEEIALCSDLSLEQVLELEKEVQPV